jgi:hypothetical protein
MTKKELVAKIKKLLKTDDEPALENLQILVARIRERVDLERDHD